jgi:hypothetical protein
MKTEEELVENLYRLDSGVSAILRDLGTLWDREGDKPLSSHLPGVLLERVGITRWVTLIVMTEGDLIRHGLTAPEAAEVFTCVQRRIAANCPI